MKRTWLHLPLPARALLWFFLSGDDYDQAHGDMAETYGWKHTHQGRFRAGLWLWLQMARSLPGFMSDTIITGAAMIKNYIKIALRNYRRHKLFNFLTVAGLTVSLTCSLLILLHVKDELSYDTFWPKGSRIYRVRTDSQYGSNFRNWAASAPGMAPKLNELMPEIERAVRIFSTGRQIFSPADNPTVKFEEESGYMAEPDFFRVFDLNLIHGDRLTALEKPLSLVLSRTLAQKLYGKEDPLFKAVMWAGLKESLQVTGVFEDLPENSHLKLNFLVSMSSFGTLRGNPENLNHVTWKSVYTYVLLQEGQTVKSFDAKAGAFMKEFQASRPEVHEKIQLQPIKSIHLHSHLEGEIGPNSDIAYVVVFSGAAMFILIIAGINFVNLSTAQSFKRVKEIGIRKVIGARRKQIIVQYLGESLVTTTASSLLSLGMLRLLIPVYNSLSGKNMKFGAMISAGNLEILLGLILLLTVLAGLYPAFFVSAFRPVNSLKTAKTPGFSSVLLRKGLVIFQFVVSIVLIFSTLTIYRQLAFFQNRNLGFEKDKLIAVRIYDDMASRMLSEPNAVRAEVLQHAAISEASFVSDLPGHPFSNERLVPVGTQDKSAYPMLRFERVDEHYLSTMGLTLLEGGNFSGVPSRYSLSFLISETTASILGLEDPVGLERSTDFGGRGRIVGVFKDFHFASLHSTIEPLVLEFNPTWAGWLMVKARPESTREVLAFLRAKMAEIAPGSLFSYQFLSDVFAQNYSSENRALGLFKGFSLLAILVSCLGLFGLTVFFSELRVKEIGVRKILGASTGNITFMLSKRFLLWVLLANAVAWPVADILMHQWLSRFAYRIGLNLWMFLFSAGAALVISLITVCSHSIKAASSNPAESLRHE